MPQEKILRLLTLGRPGVLARGPCGLRDLVGWRLVSDVLVVLHVLHESVLFEVLDLILNGPTVSDQSEYRPVWAALAETLDTYPAGASPADVGPR